jgi:hypothetical protein
MKNIICISTYILSLIISIDSQAQSNPKPFDLSYGDYCFEYWDSYTTPKTYPLNMIFHWVSKNQTSSFYEDGSDNYDCQYDNMTGSRINGLGPGGFSFTGSSSSQSDKCDSTPGKNRFVGCAVLSLKTLVRKKIQVSWTGGTVVKAIGKVPRECIIRLQYRIGTNGIFNDIPGPIEYKSALMNEDSLHIGPVLLPSECDNQKVIQLRWIYFESAKNKDLSYPQMRVGNIRVSSADMTAYYVDRKIVTENALLINSEVVTIDLNNYYDNNKYEINLFSLLGENVFSKFSDNEFVKINTGRLNKGAYIISLRNVNKNKTTYQKLFIE